MDGQWWGSLCDLVRKGGGLWTAVTQRKFSCGFGVKDAEESQGECREEVNIPYFTERYSKE